MTDVQTPPDPAPTRVRLERAKEGRVVAGVCEGLGRYFDVDPVIFRIGFAVLAFAGFSGLLAYGVAWLVIPEEGRSRPVLTWGRACRSWLPITLIVIGALALGDGWGRHDGGGPGVALIVIGALLLWGKAGRRYHRPSSSAATAAPEAESSTDAPREPWLEGVGLVDEDEDRPRSVLGRLTLSVLLVLAGGAILLGVDLDAFLALALVVVGVALVVGAWVGRSRGLVVLGLALALVAGAAASLDVPLRGGVGERTWKPTSVETLRPVYRLGAGEATLDLTELRDVRRDLDVRVTLGMGDLAVIVPPEMTVDVEASVEAGVIRLFGREDDGIDVEQSIVSRGSSEGGPRLTLVADVGLGELEVWRGAA